MNWLRHSAALLCAIVLMRAGSAAADDTPDKTQGDSPGVVKKVERGVVKGAKAAGRGLEHAAEATARGVRRGAKAVGHAAERVGRKVSGSRSPSKDAEKPDDTSP